MLQAEIDAEMDAFIDMHSDRSACRVVLGNPEGEHHVILFQEPTFADASSMWQTLRDLSQQRDDVCIESYVYPMNPEMNASLAEWQKTLYPQSALATRILVAVQQSGELRDVDRVVEWMGRADWSHNEDELLADAIGCLVQPGGSIQKVEELRDLIHSEAVTAAINSDLQQAKAAEVSWGPTLIINGKPSPSDSVNATTTGRMLDAVN